MKTLTIIDLEKFLGDKLTAEAVLDEGRQETQLLAGPNAALNTALVARRGLERVIGAVIDAIEDESGADVDCDEDALIEALAERLGLRMHTPKIEICTNEEWIGQLIGVEDFGREDAAIAWFERVHDAIIAAGFDPVNAKGQRSLYHGWNGAQFERRSYGGVGSFDDSITENKWASLTDEIGEITNLISVEFSSEND